MKITVPDFSLVVLIGASGSGKSTFVRKHFKPTEILSLDYCRSLVADDENDQSASKDDFEVVRLRRFRAWVSEKSADGPPPLAGSKA